MKFKTKPTEIEAEQFDGTMSGERLADIGVCTGGCLKGRTANALSRPHVHTMHDGQLVYLKDGDWIVPEPDGEHYYPIDNEVFQRKYERV